MPLAERLSSDYIEALKAGHSVKVSVLRMAKAAVKNGEIEKGGPLTDEEIHSVLGTLVKRNKESIEQFSKASRYDLVRKEEEELEVIQPYLPQQFSTDEVENLVMTAIRETGASGQGDLGKVMKVVMAKARGRADGKLINDLVKRGLGTLNEIKKDL
jgi:uncharacterized protein YqeY